MGEEGEGVLVSDSFYKESKTFFFLGGGGGGVSDFFTKNPVIFFY